jgi:predicted nuclease of predicted toxin-antitoxin system
LKLLFDQNLSPRLTASLLDLYPSSCHVEDCELSSAPDDQVWLYAKENGFAIVSKDSDFSERSVLLGSPPKVIWLRIGNCTTDQAGLVLRNAFAKIQAFLAGDEESCLVLSVAVKMPVRGANQ